MRGEERERDWGVVSYAPVLLIIIMLMALSTGTS